MGTSLLWQRSPATMVGLSSLLLETLRKCTVQCGPHLTTSRRQMPSLVVTFALMCLTRGVSTMQPWQKVNRRQKAGTTYLKWLAEHCSPPLSIWLTKHYRNGTSEDKPKMLMKHCTQPFGALLLMTASLFAVGEAVMRFNLGTHNASSGILRGMHGQSEGTRKGPPQHTQRTAQTKFCGSRSSSCQVEADRKAPSRLFPRSLLSH